MSEIASGKQFSPFNVRQSTDLAVATLASLGIGRSVDDVGQHMQHLHDAVVERGITEQVQPFFSVDLSESLPFDALVKAFGYTDVGYIHPLWAKYTPAELSKRTIGSRSPASLPDSQTGHAWAMRVKQHTTEPVLDLTLCTPGEQKRYSSSRMGKTGEGLLSPADYLFFAAQCRQAGVPFMDAKPGVMTVFPQLPRRHVEGHGGRAPYATSHRQNETSNGWLEFGGHEPVASSYAGVRFLIGEAAVRATPAQPSRPRSSRFQAFIQQHFFGGGHGGPLRPAI